MKAVILAAGMGSRIANITEQSPKSLLSLNNSTILGHTLDCLKKNNIKDLHIVTGYKDSLIKNYVNKNWNGNLSFNHNSIYNKSNVLYSFFLSIPYINNDEIIFIHADTIFTDNILRDLIKFRQNKDIVLPVDFKQCDEEEMKVITKNKNITKISKNISLDEAEGEFLGLAYFSNSIVKKIEKMCHHMFKKNDYSFFVEAAIQKLIDDGLRVDYLDIKKERWIEIDTPEDYEKAKKIFKN